MTTRTPACNICGSTELSVGPLNRLTTNKRYPLCKQCGSLERHRIVREILFPLESLFSNMKALQFSQDLGLNSNLFLNLEVSEFGKENSLDLQKINRPDAVYDFVYCNHVLEHVENDKAALLELTRITTHDGIIVLMVPFPLQFERTIDWGHAKPEFHGHFRVYGMNFNLTLKELLPSSFCIYAIGADPATEDLDICYFLTKSNETKNLILNKIHNAKLL